MGHYEVKKKKNNCSAWLKRENLLKYRRIFFSFWRLWRQGKWCNKKSKHTHIQAARKILSRPKNQHAMPSMK